VLFTRQWGIHLQVSRDERYIGRLVAREKEFWERVGPSVLKVRQRHACESRDPEMTAHGTSPRDPGFRRDDG
jgi:hypothetical protein